MLRRLIAVSLLTFGIVAAGLLLGGGKAEAFNNRLPDQDDINSKAVSYLVNGKTRYVKETDGTIRAWFPRNEGSVDIYQAHFCNSNDHDVIETEDGSWGSFKDGEAITRFHAHGVGPDAKDYGKVYGRKNPANCGAKLTFNFRNIQNDENGYFFVEIDIDYVGANGANKGAQNYFYMQATGQPAARLGIPGDTSTRNKGHTITLEQTDRTPQYATYTIPFGVPCGLIGPVPGAVLTFYDLDNAGGGGAQPANGPPITVRLHYKNPTNNNEGYVKFEEFPGERGKFTDNRTTWEPASADNDYQQVLFNAGNDKGHDIKYRLEIHDANYNNTLQYSLPYSQIFAESCSPEATLATNAEVRIGNSDKWWSTDRRAKTGKKLTFRNWVTTSDTKRTKDDKFTMEVADGRGGGNLPADADFTATEQLDPNRDVKPDGWQYSFTPTTPGRYCRVTRVTAKPGYVSQPAQASICVDVENGPVVECGLLDVDPDNPGYGDPNAKISVSFDELKNLPAGNYRARITSRYGLLSPPTTRYRPVDANNKTTNYIEIQTSTLLPGTYPDAIRWILVDADDNPVDDEEVCFGDITIPPPPPLQPYVQAFNGDVSSGNGPLLAFNKGNGAGENYAGSGTQVATFVGTAIDGFASKQRATTPLPVLLTFASAAGDSGYGSEFSFDNSPDFSRYWDGVNPAATGWAHPGTGISAPIEKYVTGDVYIASDITYNAGPWNLNTVPSFKLVVRGGNIYIGSGVTRLDGLYVAQAGGVSDKGRIYTCATGAGVPNAAALKSVCRERSPGVPNKLTVYGALLAESHVKFLRTGEGVVNAVAGENGGNTRAVEVFVYSPEVWLWGLGAGGSPISTTTPADSYVALPPVL